MSIKNASEFVTKIYERDESVLALLPKGMKPKSIGAQEIASITTAAKAAGWDFTADELQEAYLDSLSCNDKELADVAGGGPEYDAFSVGLANGPGGCKSNYYVEPCQSTHETGSDCACTDFHHGQTHTVC